METVQLKLQHLASPSADMQHGVGLWSVDVRQLGSLQGAAEQGTGNTKLTNIWIRDKINCSKFWKKNKIN